MNGERHHLEKSITTKFSIKIKIIFNSLAIIILNYYINRMFSSQFCIAYTVCVVCVVCIQSTLALTFVFTFDASGQGQLKASNMLDKYDFDGTFFYSRDFERDMSLDDMKSLHQRGHEVGGQTLNYINLTSVLSATAIDEICLNRKFLLGKNPKSF